MLSKKRCFMLGSLFVILISTLVIVRGFYFDSSSSTEKYSENKNMVESKVDAEIVRPETTLLFKKEYKDSENVRLFDDDNPPEIFRNFNFEGFKKEDMKEFLPDPWEIEDFSEEIVFLKYKGEEYKKDNSGDDNYLEGKRYIGRYKDRIAIYKDAPSEGGELLEVTPYEVKEVYEKELEEGIPFETEKDKERILESYTS